MPPQPPVPPPSAKLPPDALGEIRDNAGTQFDPAAAAALERVVSNDERYPRLVEGVAASHAVAAAIGAPVPLPQPDERTAAVAS